MMIDSQGLAVLHQTLQDRIKTLMALELRAQKDNDRAEMLGAERVGLEYAERRVRKLLDQKPKRAEIHKLTAVRTVGGGHG